MEQRQSVRFDRKFLVTDHEDEGFAEPFLGHDVNLTGLSFWVDNPDWFFPGQQVSLRIKNLENNEQYCLDGVEVIHLQTINNRLLCGCHITQVSSSQLLAHHRTVVVDEYSAQQMQDTSDIDDFDFDEEGTQCSDNLTDFQELVMVTLLQYEQFKKSYALQKHKMQELQTALDSKRGSKIEPEWFSEQLHTLESTQEQLFKEQRSWSLFAKLLAFTPQEKTDRQAWQTMIADYEALHLSEKQQVAFDFMHQGMVARKSLAMARDYMQAQENSQLELEDLADS